MSVSESARLALYNRLGEVIGPENAETLMSSLPLQPAAQLATKDDVGGLRTEMHELRTELRTEMHELRTEMHELRTEVIRQYRTFLTLTLGSLVALTGIFSIIVSLLT
jgi:hypothetical protein